MGGETGSGTLAASRHLELLHWVPFLALGHQLDLSSSCEQRARTHNRVERTERRLKNCAGRLAAAAADSGSTSRSVSSLGTAAAVSAVGSTVSIAPQPNCAVTAEIV